MTERIEKALESNVPNRGNKEVKPPEVAVVDIVFERSKSSADYRYLKMLTSRKRNIQQTLPFSNGRAKIHANTAKTAQDDSFSSELCTSSGNEIVLPSHLSMTKETACGLSINWHQSCRASCITEVEKNKSTEITISATGMKRGKKPKTPNSVFCSASRLCRYNFLQRSLTCAEIHECIVSSYRGITGEGKVQGRNNKSGSSSGEISSYMQLKQKCSPHNVAEFFIGPMMGYLRSENADDFVLHQTSNYNFLS